VSFCRKIQTASGMPPFTGDEFVMLCLMDTNSDGRFDLGRLRHGENWQKIGDPVTLTNPVIYAKANPKSEELAGFKGAMRIRILKVKSSDVQVGLEFGAANDAGPDYMEKNAPVFAQSDGSVSVSVLRRGGCREGPLSRAKRECPIFWLSPEKIMLQLANANQVRTNLRGSDIVLEKGHDNSMTIRTLNKPQYWWSLENNNTTLRVNQRQLSHSRVAQYDNALLRKTTSHFEELINLFLLKSFSQSSAALHPHPLQP
jgi:hypothetical protein